VLRITFEPIITTWEYEFTGSGRQRIGASLPAPVFVRAERRETPLTAEFGITNRIAVSARVPLVRVWVQAQNDTGSAGRSLDSLLRDSTYLFSPIRNTRRGLRFFSGDAELEGKYRLFSGHHSGTSVALVVRFPTGHQDSPHDLFDLASGDDQTDIEARITQELIVANRLWLNAALRLTRQQPGTRERRVGPQATLLLPRAATALLDWDPGDYLAVDVAPLYRFSPYFGAGLTAGYYTRTRDHYSYRSTQDSVQVAAAHGFDVPASFLDAGTSQRWVRLGVAITYRGPEGSVEGGLSFEQTVSGAGGRIPAASVFRVVMRTSRWPF
jgi:hypothetical protein